ncbi:hypothetical protein IC582_003110 [Cucumis melo]
MRGGTKASGNSIYIDSTRYFLSNPFCTFGHTIMCHRFIHDDFDIASTSNGGYLSDSKLGAFNVNSLSLLKL